jgi:choline dehydrogenase-like flavoprotein
MIIDSHEIVGGSAIDAAFCIVGGGPAGITLALKLAETGREVVLLESGDREARDEIQTLNAGEVADETLHSPPDKYRVRCLGGSTSIWGGRCMPFDRIDFESRSWIPNSGWPISYDELEPFYRDANALCEAGDFEYDARLAVPGGMQPVIRGFAPAHFDVNGIERFSCPTNFGDRYSERLARLPNLRVFLRSTVVRLGASDDGSRIESVEVRSVSNAAFTVRADQVVVAAGGLETPRLLLTSNDVHTEGLGNAHGLVGRYYMCHIAGTVGALKIHGPRDAVWHGYDVAWDGTYCRRRIALRPDVQRVEGVGNVIFRLHHPRIADPAHGTGPLSAIFLAQRFISYEYAKRLVSGSPPSIGTWLRHGYNAVRDSASTARFLMHWARHRTLAARKFPSIIIRPRTNLFSLDFHAEQLPNPESRVGLSDTVDRFGNRTMRIDWRYTRLDVETVERAFVLLRDELAQTNIGTLQMASDEADIETALRRDGAYGGHHIGTARMGASERTGVVDRHGKVFGLSNLFVAGSAIFPTSSQANPTLTIVATSLRLAKHLREIAEDVVSVKTEATPVPAG